MRKPKTAVVEGGVGVVKWGTIAKDRDGAGVQIFEPNCRKLILKEKQWLSELRRDLLISISSAVSADGKYYGTDEIFPILAALLHLFFESFPLPKNALKLQLSCTSSLLMAFSMALKRSAN